MEAVTEQQEEKVTLFCQGCQEGCRKDQAHLSPAEDREDQEVKEEVEEDVVGKEDKEDKEDEGTNNNCLPAAVSMDEMELLKKLEEANR